jgi:hypothetical protein
MPYHVGAKGSYGCSGYPALKDDGTVMGCHTTREQAANQIYAINQSEGNIKSMDSEMDRYKNSGIDRSFFANSRNLKPQRLGEIFNSNVVADKVDDKYASKDKDKDSDD